MSPEFMDFVEEISSVPSSVVSYYTEATICVSDFPSLRQGNILQQPITAKFDASLAKSSHVFYL